MLARSLNASEQRWLYEAVQYALATKQTPKNFEALLVDSFPEELLPQAKALSVQHYQHIVSTQPQLVANPETPYEPPLENQPPAHSASDSEPVYEPVYEPQTEESYQQYTTTTTTAPADAAEPDPRPYSEPFPLDRNPTREELEAKGQELLWICRRRRASCLPVNLLNSARFYEFQIVPDIEQNVAVDAVMKLQQDFIVHAGLPQSTLLERQSGSIGIQVPKVEWEPLRFLNHFTPKVMPPQPELPLTAYIGLDKRLEWIKQRILGVALGGAFESGKSCWIKQVVLSLMASRNPNDFKVIFVDVKPEGYDIFDRSPWSLGCDDFLSTESNKLDCLRAKCSIKDPGDFYTFLQLALIEGAERQTLFRAHGTNNLLDFNQVQPNMALPQILVIVDETGMTLGSPGSSWRKKIGPLSIQAVKALRSSGFCWVFGDQRPANRVIPEDVDTNLTLRIGFQVGDKNDSEIVLGRGYPQAMYLRGHGDGFCRSGGELQRFQSALVKDSDILSFLRWSTQKYRNLG
jgi:hypothetical protein